MSKAGLLFAGERIGIKMVLQSREKYRYVIITPVRDEGGYIEKTIKSVISQTITPIRWIIVNDGSTDNTGDIIKKYSKHYTWITVINRPDKGFRALGSKVVEAFNVGCNLIQDLDYDFIVKLTLTGSFSSIITFLFALCILAFMSNKIKYYARYLIVAIPIIGVIIYYFFLPVVMYRLHQQFRYAETIIPETFVFRVYGWKWLVPRILEVLPWGLGPAPHCTETYYLLLLAVGGLFAMVAFFGSISVLLKNLKNIFANSLSLTKLLSLVGIVFILQILVANMGGNYFEYSGVSETLWVIQFENK